MPQIENTNPENETPVTNKKNWLKRFGIVSILFFTIKGIAWLFVGKTVLTWLGCHN